MLATFSMVLLVPTPAQALNTPFVGCINHSTGDLFLYDSVKGCPNGFERSEYMRSDADGHVFTGVCIVKTGSSYGGIEIGPDGFDDYMLNTTGDKCESATGPAWPYRSYASIKAYDGGDDNGNGNVNINTNTNNNTGRGGGTNSNNNGSSAQVPCENEPGFHKVGPLCVPNSPVSDPNAVVNKHDFPSLAAMVIKILLYFAGIVAVIFAIIGGYQIMTAQGNAAQATNGRKTLTNALIGLGIVILAYIIVQAVVSFLTKPL